MHVSPVKWINIMFDSLELLEFVSADCLHDMSFSAKSSFRD